MGEEGYPGQYPWLAELVVFAISGLRVRGVVGSASRQRRYQVPLNYRWGGRRCREGS